MITIIVFCNKDIMNQSKKKIKINLIIVFILKKILITIINKASILNLATMQNRIQIIYLMRKMKRNLAIMEKRIQIIF